MFLTGVVRIDPFFLFLQTMYLHAHRVDALAHSWIQGTCLGRKDVGRKGTEGAENQMQSKVLATRNYNLNLRWANPPGFPL